MIKLGRIATRCHGLINLSRVIRPTQHLIRGHDLSRRRFHPHLASRLDVLQASDVNRAYEDTDSFDDEVSGSIYDDESDQADTYDLTGDAFSPSQSFASLDRQNEEQLLDLITSTLASPHPVNILGSTRLIKNFSSTAFSPTLRLAVERLFSRIRHEFDAREFANGQRCYGEFWTLLDRGNFVQLADWADLLERLASDALLRTQESPRQDCSTLVNTLYDGIAHARLLSSWHGLLGLYNADTQLQVEKLQAWATQQEQGHHQDFMQILLSLKSAQTGCP